MAEDTPTTLLLMTTAGPVPLQATKDNSTPPIYTLQSTPRVLGDPVNFTNPMPVVKPPGSGGFSAAAEGSHVLKASPGVLSFIQCNATQPGWVMLFDSITLPNNGPVTPRRAWWFDAASQQTLDKTLDPPLQMINGAVLAFSAGPNNFTLAIAGAVAGFAWEMV